MRLQPYIALLLIASLASCKFFRKDDGRKPIARVADSYLYEDELAGLTTGMSKEDSTVFVRNYIYNWGKEQLLIQRAEYNLRDDQKDFEELVNQYRHDLIKFAYLEKYVAQNLDTTVTEDAIQAYYDANGKDFELKENIIRCDFYVFKVKTPELTKAKEWWRSPNKKNEEKFNEYAGIFSIQKSVGDTNWISFDQLATQIPVLPTYNQEQLISRNQRLLLEDSVNVYFIRFNGYKIADDVSPLPYVRGTIRSIILNKRKLDLLADMEKRLVDEAFNEKEFEIY